MTARDIPCEDKIRKFDNSGQRRKPVTIRVKKIIRVIDRKKIFVSSCNKSSMYAVIINKRRSVTAETFMKAPVNGQYMQEE